MFLPLPGLRQDIEKIAISAAMDVWHKSDILRLDIGQVSITSETRLQHLHSHSESYFQNNAKIVLFLRENDLYSTQKLAVQHLMLMNRDYQLLCYLSEI